MKAFCLGLMLLAIVLALAGIRSELRGILYQMTLANCLTMAERGVRCDEWEPEQPAPASKGTMI